MTANSNSLRTRLLIGASIGAMLFTGVAEAQDRSGGGRVFGGRGGGDPTAAAARAAQDQATRANETNSATQRAITAFRRAAETRQAMNDAQAAARALARSTHVTVPNGIGPGGLQVANGVELDPNLWSGANGPVQSGGENGRTNVAIDQTQQKAILTWDSFNVGRETDLVFNQGGADWVALNRVTDVNADPTKILGSIKADGSVYIINRNGIIFGGASQVNVRNLIASTANISNDQFLNRGIYSNLSGANYVPSFTDAGGAVTVEAGAQITTNTPQSVTAGGGFVLLMGMEVTNEGSITTPKGQTTLSAGDDFIIRRGYGTEENQYSTTRGNEVRGLIDAGSASGTVINAGLIEATQGDITLAGRTIRQDGVLVSTTSVNQRGTIHLLNSATDGEGSVTLGADSLTIILPEVDSEDTALNGQRDALIAESEAANAQRATTTNGGFNDRSTLADQLDQSRIEIVTGGDVVFEGGSQTSAQGGQVAVQANAGRITVVDGARIDVSGVMGVALDMESNAIVVNIQGNEMRDSPANRDSDNIRSQDVWIDVRDLILLPDGTGGYEGDRWYTPGGLLEVGGYLANMSHGIGEWAAVGGTITLAANEVVAQQGAVFDISGGSLDYQSGYVRSTRVMGADGRMYDIRNAPAYVTMVSVGNAFMRKHERWGEMYTEVYSDPLFSRGTSSRWEQGYSVGRDAGQLILSAPTVIMEADILAEVIKGERQTNARADGVTDGYKVGQHTAAQGGSLVLGRYGLTAGQAGAALHNVDVRIGDIADLTAELGAGDALPEDRAGTAWFNAGRLNDAGLGGIDLKTRGAIAIESDLILADGGQVNLVSHTIDIDGTITARSGSVNATNAFAGDMTQGGQINLFDSAGRSSITLQEGATLDLRGVWTNAFDDPASTSGLAHRDGGSASFSAADITLAEKSTIDVSSGAAIVSDRSLLGGQGGDVTLLSDRMFSTEAVQGTLTLDGEIVAHGVDGGGRLNLQAGSVLIDNAGSDVEAGTLLLRNDFFDKGFSSYQVVGNRGLEVADGAQVDVLMPVYRQKAATGALATGMAPGEALELWTPPVYQEAPTAGVLSQRRGASLTLQAGGGATAQTYSQATLLRIGQGAKINVDPGQAIALQGSGQITVDGTLNAWGGSIDLRQGGAVGTQAPAIGLSIWIGETATLDVSARAATAVDAQGRRYGQIRNGGTIVIGGEIDHAAGSMAGAASFVVIEEGAVLDASGTQAVLDIAGQGATAVASNGGSISLASGAGLYLDGQMRANAGGAGAAGGSLSVAMGVRVVAPQAADRLQQIHELVVGQEIGSSMLGLGIDAEQAVQSLVYGHARVGVDQVEAGGFDTLSLYSGGMIAFDGNVNLAMGQSLNLYAGSLGLTEASAADTQVKLSAPYVRLAGSALPSMPDNATGFSMTGMHYGVPARPSSQQPEAGSFTLEAGKLLDITAGEGLGSGGHLVLPRADGISEQVDRRAFDSMNLVSQGDIRFGSGTLYVPGDLTLAAAQIFPGTGISATVHAGWQGNSSPYASDRRLVIARTTDTNPTLPYSLFGSLTLGGHTIDQGGILRAPLGAINLGPTSTATWNTQNVHLLPGSVTSVSAGGLLMPYGGTMDGVTWEYDGEAVTLYSAGGTQGATFIANRDLKVGVTLRGESIDIRDGSLIDLSGGGELLGAAFVSGRGGSTDARFHPLMQYDADGRLLPTLPSNPVYALVPGVQRDYAPSAGASGALDPMLGQQVTIGSDVPGLQAGTYTLLPSTYALLPGAFRVEINDRDGQALIPATTAMGNGSWSTSGVLSIGGTGIRESVARELILTSADVLRTYSQYNETSYAEFARADAGRLGVPRGMIEADAKTLEVILRDSSANSGEVNFRFDGRIAGAAAEGGFGSTVAVVAHNSRMELLADDGQAAAGYLSLYASDLSAMDVNRLVIGGRPVVAYGQNGNLVDFGLGINLPASAIVLRSGAELSAAEVMLVTQQTYANPSGIEIEQGASITTLGRGAAAYDSEDGFVYQPADKSVLAVSNGRLQWLAPQATSTLTGPGTIRVGTCSSGNCEGTTSLYSEGSIAFLTDSAFELDDAVRYGTRHLTLGVGAFNIGTADALASASANGVLTSGLTLNQTVLDRLLRGDTTTGAPALETLELAAAQSLNFFGSVTLSTLNEAGESLLDNLMLTTPAIYGHGTQDDRALIQTGHLIWNGSADRPGAVVTGGAGTGTGAFEIEAKRIEFGYGAYSQPSGVDNLARLTLGFANVTLNASDRITANNRGSLAVYQSQGAYVAGEGYSYSGGNLYIVTPLLTGDAGSVNRISAGGDIRVRAAAGASAGTVGKEALGAELSLSGRSLYLDSSVILPSGKLTLDAEQDIILGDAALLDLAGRSVKFFDDKAATQYSWGGDVMLRSAAGNILQAAGSRIDVSAENNQAGRLTAIALGAAAGTVDLQGQIHASASGDYEAGGTRVPHLGGGVDIRAQRLGDSGTLDSQFTALNARLNEGEVFGLRSFQIKQGDLTIGSGLKANEINVSIDGGHLTVTGTVDASGERVGSIRLAGRNGLSLTQSAVLDAHGSILRKDSYGQIIDAPNRAAIELSSGDGLLSLAAGVRIDLRHGTAHAGVDSLRRGSLELNAPRLGGATAGDIAIDASGSVDISGARSIAVNAVQRYDDAAYGSDTAASGRPYQVIDQAYLDTKHAESTAFISAALANDALLGTKLAGLNNATYADAFHLRPGVEIVSATPDGDMIVSGDLDLSGHRYASLNPNTPRTAVYGSGEIGTLVLRAGGDLDVYGSINDGFAPPPETPDDNSWQLTEGYIAYGGEVVIPGPGVVLASGTEFAAGKTLNYDLPVQATSYPAGTQLPTVGVLDANLTLQAGTVLRGDIHDAAGTLLHAAGTVLDTAVTLTVGSRLGAGSILPAQVRLRAMTWPKGMALPVKLVLASDLTMLVGALIPSETLVRLPGDAISAPLRPLNGNRQGANWAVAQMLPEGSQSWSIRAVAGADIQAADNRAVRVGGRAGTLTLADTHYSMLRVLAGGGVQYWSEDNFFGMTPGTPVDDWALDPGYNVCVDEVGQCVLVNWLWSEDNFFGMTPGTPVDEWALDPGYNVCVDEVGQCVNIGGSGEVAALRPATQKFSVVRTGTGNLDLIAGRDLRMQSLYGVYTAGMSTASRAGSQTASFNQPRAIGTDGSYLGTVSSAEADIAAGYEGLVDGGANSSYAAWYPDLGGSLLVRSGGDLTGDLLAESTILGDDRHLRAQSSSVNLNNWLWRQGSGDVAGVGAMPTSWWINFGTYVPGRRRTNEYVTDGGGVQAVPELVGFTGFGTLGGGNLTVEIGGNAGMLTPRGGNRAVAPRSQGLALAVGSTGRVTANGEMLLTGGGDMRLRIGGDLNPGLQARAEGDRQTIDLGGVLTNLRGDLNLIAGALGGVDLRYSNLAGFRDLKESRAYDPYNSTRGSATGGMVLMLGDASANLVTRGDLVLAGSGDPGRISQLAGPAYSYDGQTYTVAGRPAGSGASSWFSLWTENTAINLFSAGGNLTPSTQMGDAQDGRSRPGRNYTASDGRFVYPSQLGVVAANGSIYLGASAQGQVPTSDYDTSLSLLLAPSKNASLSLLAGNSIYASGYAVNQSGASLDAMPTPLRPAVVLSPNQTSIAASNISGSAMLPNAYNLFTFGANSSAGSGSVAPARFYAGSGDIVGLRSGETLSFAGGNLFGQTWYESAGPVWMMAGRDIVSSGTPLGQPTRLPLTTPPGTSTGNLFVHNDANDVSIVSAGRDILHSSFQVAGPGALEISAGRNILMEDKATVTSLGAVVPGDTRPGASITMMAGMTDVNWSAVRDLYLDPAKLADPERPLGDPANAGKAVKVYGEELAEWLDDRYGFAGTGEEALAYFDGLSTEQQRIFLRQVYYAETREGGREYNNSDSSRFGSYLRGRDMIATLFPDKDAEGNEITRTGDILMFGGSGVRTNFGGDIEMMVPGGQIVIGVQGEVPPASAGIITQGTGDINLFSEQSLLLGLSRIMTTFGGSIFGWSEEGDINAGRGAKTTVLFTPPLRTYDAYGNVRLAPQVPSSGAGIATLNPIPEVPAGDIDLVAPLGTIDAGEAGIRVSGNINLAALQVLNAANIQVQGEAAGVPQAVVVNTGALTAASSASTAVAAQAANLAERSRPQMRTEIPTILNVRFLGFGE